MMSSKENEVSDELKVVKFRLCVFRAWGQVAVKDFYPPQTAKDASDYAKATWNDCCRITVKVYHEKNEVSDV